MSDIWKQPEKDKQDQLRSKFEELLKRKPMSLRSVARECMVNTLTLSTFMQGHDVNWVTFCKIDAFIGRKLIKMEAEA